MYSSKTLQISIATMTALTLGGIIAPAVSANVVVTQQAQVLPKEDRQTQYQIGQVVPGNSGGNDCL